MSIPVYILAGLAMVLGVVLLVFTTGNEATAGMLIVGGMTAGFGAKVMQVKAARK